MRPCVGGLDFLVKTGGCVCLFAWVGGVPALLLSVGVGACVLVRGLR